MKQTLALLGIGSVLGSLVWRAEAAPENPDLRPITADGKTETTLAITLPRSVADPRVLVTVTAGTVLDTKVTGAHVEIRYRSPRVVEPMAAELRLQSAAFGAIKRALRLVPASQPPELRKLNGPLEFQTPTELILGVHQRQRFKVRVPPTTSVTLMAAPGRVEVVGREGAYLVGEYVLPEERFPHTAILAAFTNDGRVVDATTIRLLGRPMVEARSQPGTTIRVRIGTSEFGPVLIDRSGLSRLRVLAPPGTRSALTVAQNRMGSETFQQTPLEAPTKPALLIACPSAGGHALLFAVDGNGQPLAARELRLSATGAQLGSLTRKGMGWSIPLLYPKDARSGESVTVTAAIEGARAECTSQVPIEEPNRIALTIGRQQVQAGSRLGVSLSLEFPDRLSGAPCSTCRRRRLIPRIQVSLGSLSRLKERGSGRFVAEWSIPHTAKPGWANIVAEVDRPALRAERRLRIVDSPRPVMVPPSKLPQRFGIEMSARIGLLTNFARLTAPLGAVTAGYRLPFLRELIAGIELGVFGSESSVLDTTGTESVEIGVVGGLFNARVMYERRFGQFAAFAGSAFGLSVTRETVRAASASPATRTNASVALEPFLGGGIQAGPGLVLLQIGYLFAPASSAELTGNRGGLELSGGYGLGF